MPDPPEAAADNTPEEPPKVEDIVDENTPEDKESTGFELDEFAELLNISPQPEGPLSEDAEADKLMEEKTFVGKEPEEKPEPEAEVEPEPEPEPEAEKPAEEKPDEKPEEAEEPKAEPEPESEAVKAEPEAEAEAVEKPQDIEAMRDLISELLAQQAQAAVATPAAEPEAEPAAPVDAQLVTQEEMDEALESLPKFNALMNKVSRHAGEEMFKAMPDVVRNLVEYRVAVGVKTEEFYRDNPDLKGYKPVVSLVGRQLQSEHQDWDIDKLLEETNKEVRRKLMLGKAEDGPVLRKEAEKTKKKPAFVRPGGSSGSRTESHTDRSGQSAFDREYDELMDVTPLNL